MKENDLFNEGKWIWIVKEAIPKIISLTDKEVSLPLLSLLLSGSCRDKISTVNNKTEFPIINITGKNTAEKILYVSYFKKLFKGNTKFITCKAIVQRELHSRALVVLSELPITNEELNDKVIAIDFPYREFTDDGLPYMGFPRVTTQMLDDLDLGYFLEGYLRFIDELYVTGRLKELYEQAEIMENDFKKDSKFNSLQILNKVILVFGALILRELLRKAELDFEVTDDDIRDMLIHTT